MDVRHKAGSWAKWTGLLALLAFSGACSDMSAPTGLDSTNIDRQFLLGIAEETPPPVVLSLTLEQLTFAGINRTVTWSNCSSPLDGTFGYSVRGTASVIYEGRFTETGTVTISNGQVTSLKAKFTIVGTSIIDPDGGDYTIRGKKELRTLGVGECLNVGQVVDPTVTTPDLRYVAKIITPGGHRFFDRGTSMLVLSEEGVPGTVMNTTFDETFLSDDPSGAAKPCVEVEAGITIEQCPDLDI